MELFEQNLHTMPNYGGDVETLFLNCKIIHSNRVIFSPEDVKKILTVEDVEKGFEYFSNDRRKKNSYVDKPETNIWSNN